MTTWNKIKEDLEEGVSIAKKGAKLIADKAVTETEVIRHRINIKSYDSKIRKLYTEIGEITYEEILKKNENIHQVESINDICKKISDFFMQREKEASLIEEAKKEHK